MRVGVIGTGHVGLVTAATLASFGHELGWKPKVPLDTGLERMVAWAPETWTT